MTRSLLFCFLLGTFALAISADHPSIGLTGPANGEYTGVPAGWICPALWFNEYERAVSGDYAQFSKTNLQQRFGVPPNTPLPTETNYWCDCGCGVYDPDCNRPVLAFSENEAATAQSRISCAGNPPVFPPGTAVGREPTHDVRYTVCKNSDATCTTTEQLVPDTWHCEPRLYNQLQWNNCDDAFCAECNCGCGAYDPDCDVQETHYIKSISCNAYDDILGKKHDIETTFCRSDTYTCDTIPDGWSCDPRLYDQQTSGYGEITCDCACGIWDPDCDLQFNSDQPAPPLDCGLGTEVNGEAVNTFSLCRYAFIKGEPECYEVPDDWTCAPALFHEAFFDTSLSTPTCDCGCGAWDPDCDLLPGSKYLLGNKIATLGHLLTYNCHATPDSVDQILPPTRCRYDTLQCEAVHPNWLGPANWYNQDASDTRSVAACDCGFGVWDPDCDVRGLELFCSLTERTPSSDAQYCAKQPVTIGEVELIQGVCRYDFGTDRFN